MWKWEWICWFVSLISRSPSQRVRRFRRLIERLSREADLEDGWWHVFRDYPKQAVPSSVSVVRSLPAQQASDEPSDDEADDTCAIVMQGPVIERDEMTFQTLSLYRQTMPNAQLILSTWNDIPDQTRQRIEALGVVVVTGEKPKHFGPHNLNLQITSTFNGLRKAKELGCRYAMKTRADSRIHVADVDQFCLDLIRQYALGDVEGQSARILVTDFATRLYVPYHPSDMLMFGMTDDLLSYWAPELCGPEMTFQVCDQFDEMLQQATPEIVLCRNYLNRIGVSLDETLEQWWQILADRFVVIDRDMIDLFWPKYNYNVDQRLSMLWDTGNMALCHFTQWMQIYRRRLVPSVTLDQLRLQTVHQSLMEVPDLDSAEPTAERSAA